MQQTESLQNRDKDAPPISRRTMGVRLFVPVLVAIVGLVATGWIAHSTQQYRYSQDRARFLDAASRLDTNTDRLLLHYGAAIRGVGSLFAAYRDADTLTFSEYVKSMISQEHYPAVVVWGWLTLRHSETAPTRHGGGSLEGRSSVPTSTTGQLQEFLQYLPYSDQQKSSYEGMASSIVGSDLLGAAGLTAVFWDACDQHKLRLSGIPRWAFGSDSGNTVFLCLPVYREEASHAVKVDRRKHLSGWAVLGIDVERFVAQALAIDRDGLEIRLWDITESPRLLNPASPIPSNNKERLVGERFTDKLDFGGREWMVEILPGNLQLPAPSVTAEYAPVVVSLLATLLLTFLTSVIVNDRANAVRLASQLETTNQQLQCVNEQVRQVAIDAKAATQAKSDFLANMSHEIRTPMTAILGYADLMLEESIGRTAREYVEVIKRNGEHLIGLINDILDLSKVEVGKMQMELTRCSPLQLAAEVMSLMRVRAEAKHLTLQADLTGNLPETVVTDPLRLRQVLVNLVGNAIKFTEQGTVRLVVRLTSEDGHPLLCFDVIDTGIGISEEHINKLFSPFTQVDSSTTRKFSGTGLGLYISKRLAEALGGDITVRSNSGKGSTFSVTVDPGPLNGIPMTKNAQEALLDHTPTTSAATPAKAELHGRVLLAEDGLDNQRLISFLLKKAGSDVVAVENGQLAVTEAINAWKQGQPFDVILMDMQMPVMDGYSATGELRSQGYIGTIIALTAHAMAEDRQKCFDAGCNDYITKPINRQKLLATLAHWEACEKQREDTCTPITAAESRHGVLDAQDHNYTETE